MTGLLRAELIKTFKRRTFWVLTIVLVLLTGFLAGIFYLLPRVIDDQGGLFEIQKPAAYIFGAGQVMGQTWFPLILATMALAGELATSAWSTTLTRNSRRGQHLVARLLTSTAAAWLAVLLAIVVFSIATFFLAEGTGELDAAAWWDIVWKALLVQFTWVALGLAFSAWLRSVGPAIGAALAFTFVEGLLILWEGFRQVSLSIHTSALLGSLSVGGFGQILGDLPSFRRGLIVVLSWSVIGVLIAWAGLKLRDA
ncbi:MAG TPA: hypothetical protein VIB78_03245 [Acidimicrobiia bacterium]